MPLKSTQHRPSSIDYGSDTTDHYNGDNDTGFALEVGTNNLPFYCSQGIKTNIELPQNCREFVNTPFFEQF